ncbi:MAG: PAS domain S-box protein [Acidobacteria bacterium]|nr:PAS domain S-box protein [Acidobacteriota bacterium]MBV9476033.1 PAS domain S-box protein [Acidobacteriota bacterium]
MKELLASTGGVFRKLVEEARDVAILLLDARGGIELWNEGAQRIFGYTAEEVHGRHFSLLFLPADVDSGVPEAELASAFDRGSADDTRWHVHRDGHAIFVDGMTMPLFADDDGRLLGYSKFARDVTERRRTEERLAAQLSLTRLLNEDQAFSVAAPQVMQIVCENLGWDIGALWEVRGDRMRCVDLWHATYVDGTAAAALCRGQEQPRGAGLIGEVWETRDAEWVKDFSDGKRFPRAELAAAAGMRAAFAFPIIHEGRVSGAMEFFSRAPREPEQALLPVMTLIGAQIGDYIDRRRTHQALRESEERYRLVSQTAQDAILTIDENSVITFCNPAVERMFGYRPEELVGQSLDVIIPERLRSAHRGGVRRFLQTRERHIPWGGVELPALHKDGHEVPCEISFGECTVDGRTIFTGFARDITERNRVAREFQELLAQEQAARAEAEEAKAQIERRADEEASFRHLASALSGAVEMTDVLYEITNRATHVTRADGVYVERIVGPTSARQVEVVAAAGRGVPARGLRVTFPGSLTEEIMTGAAPVILADMKALGREMAPYLADICPRCELLVTPLVAEKEPLGALVLLNSGTSGRHFGDGDIVRARTLGDLTSLALRRVRLMEEEREAKERAEAAVRVRDETLGIVSHDLRNPLTKVALSADLLVDATPEEQPELVETIRNAAKQMQRLIQDLLDVARIEAAGRLSVALAPIEAADIVREVCDTNSALAQQKQVRIVCEMPAQLPRICADHDRLVQVFGNLIGNAIKFTPPRGTISIEAKPANGFVQFTVHDTGPGIPAADLKNVFTPYWQAKKTAHMGAGLGLAIVRGIVESHGGRVWAENDPRGGAVFRFTIPTA